MTRAQFQELTAAQALEWHTPPESQGQIVLRRYAASDGYYWRAVEDTSLPPDHPDRVEVWRADATNSYSVPDPSAWAPWSREPRGIRWRRFTEATR